jgi:hypothetical protein
MSRTIFGVLVLVAVALSVGVAEAQQTDTLPPTLLSIDVSPASVDVSTGPAEITVTVQLRDDISGVAWWSTTFYSQLGTDSITIGGSPGLVSGTVNDGSFVASSTLPQLSEEGTWSATIVTVTDAAGNTADIDLSAYGIFLIQVGTTLEDLTPPILRPLRSHRTRWMLLFRTHRLLCGRI